MTYMCTTLILTFTDANVMLETSTCLHRDHGALIHTYTHTHTHTHIHIHTHASSALSLVEMYMAQSLMFPLQSSLIQRQVR